MFSFIVYQANAKLELLLFKPVLYYLLAVTQPTGSFLALLSHLSHVLQDEVSLISSQAMSQMSNKGDVFQSDATVVNYGIKVNDTLIDRCATALSHNDMVINRDDGSARSRERTRLLAQRKAM